jgi:hypothetical protein
MVRKLIKCNRLTKKKGGKPYDLSRINFNLVLIYQKI